MEQTAEVGGKQGVGAIRETKGRRGVLRSIHPAQTPLRGQGKVRMEKGLLDLGTWELFIVFQKWLW